MNILHHITYSKASSSEWVTFVHGAGGSSSIWYKQIRAFSEHFNVLLIDLRGHGKSKEMPAQTTERYTFHSIGEDVLKVLDHLQIQKSHFVGISLGTIVIREITEKFPDRVHSMILGGAVMKLNVKGQILLKAGYWLKSLVPYLMLYRLFAFIIMPRQNHKESRNLFVREAKKLYQQEFIRWFRLATNLQPLLRLFREKDSGVPTLFVMGEEDHMFLPAISNLVQYHTSTRLAVIPECGHVVNVEKPELFNQLCIEFIRKLRS
jgi:pimeloyl-ACP methyl ester carboxylesterase